MLAFLLTPNRDVTDKIADDRHKGSRIRCPQCQWEPQAHDLWSCAPGCGQVWNTFATRGKCPGCSKHWMHTACHRCDVWSVHEAWYELPEDPKGE